ncbi:MULTISPECIES: anti-sigma factor family protein [unclassified Nocardioides]|uniref:anti-sigma factor family protein n=1 Tax=unclassified Nocardioides TaxID=2615069 RepID=UPI0006F74DAB|nr:MULTISPECIES: zf-HC2 domain-containing protein [unclassified Nocardioides]KRA31038.1 hypothetical protein ASD81_16215 [Nocardioides sp. Root614]KRA87659.1 hypothetical protein ASD84_16490 [Nocardioides sp. Root682]
MNCEFTHLDGAYVISSLAPSEQAVFEQHLSGCAECSRAVADLTGLPGLLARVPVEIVEQSGERETAPATLLPALVSRVRRSRRRRDAATAILCAACVIAAVAITGAVVASDDPSLSARSAPSVTTAPAIRMGSVGSGRVTGWVSLTGKEWGTRIDLTCTYASADEDTWTSYAIFIRSRDGRVEQVGTWRAESGKRTTVTLATSAAPDDIGSVEVRAADGTLVLQLAA